jgi:hypothetical protein
MVLQEGVEDKGQGITHDVISVAMKRKGDESNDHGFHIQ